MDLVCRQGCVPPRGRWCLGVSRRAVVALLGLCRSPVLRILTPGSSARAFFFRRLRNTPRTSDIGRPSNFSPEALSLCDSLRIRLGRSAPGAQEQGIIALAAALPRHPELEEPRDERRETPYIPKGEISYSKGISLIPREIPYSKGKSLQRLRAFESLSTRFPV